MVPHAKTSGYFWFRNWKTIAAALLAALLLAAWLTQTHAAPSGGSERESVSRKPFPGKLPITELTEDQAILHALNRLGFGPRPGDVERVREMGLETWIERQLN